MKNKSDHTGTLDQGGTMSSTTRHFTPTITSLATAYDDQSGSGELVIPKTFEGMEYQAVTELYASAVEAFDAIYADAAEDMTEEQEAQLGTLAEGIEALASEIQTRDAAKAERAERAAELAAKVKGFSSDSDEEAKTDELSNQSDEDEDDAEGDDNGDEEEGNDNEDDNSAETVTAAGTPRSEVRVPLSGVKRKAPKKPAAEKPSMKSVAYASGEGIGYASGSGMDFIDIGNAIDRKLQGFNSAQYKNAAKSGRHIREQHGIVSIKREFPEELRITSSDRDHVENVMNYAVNESRLPKGGLIAAGGWCAPSETLYDLLELESRSGLLSLPEVGVSRGGISFTPGPSFSDLYSGIAGFSFTEDQDIAGEYQPGDDANEVGPKPCYNIECPDFEEARLEVDGLCITAGLLMARGYPEVIARTVRGALVAHDHRVNAGMINRMVEGSDAVSLAADQAGATAPLLTGIELQAMHYRYTHRLADNATLEGVFPYWVRGAIRADLARRQGVDLIDVPDARIDAWFRERGLAPQYVYNWQAIDATASTSFTEWPTEVKFMLYAAGTWVRGSSDIITLDTVYDSTLLANNDYTALFTEEGWLVAKRGHDSRVVTVPICADGATHQGVLIECDGTVAGTEG